MKIGVIGAGAVGSACLLSSILRGPVFLPSVEQDRRPLSHDLRLLRGPLPHQRGD
jgi:ketopantoate reductase